MFEFEFEQWAQCLGRSGWVGAHGHSWVFQSRVQRFLLRHATADADATCVCLFASPPPVHSSARSCCQQLSNLLHLSLAAYSLSYTTQLPLYPLLLLTPMPLPFVTLQPPPPSHPLPRQLSNLLHLSLAACGLTHLAQLPALPLLVSLDLSWNKLATLEGVVEEEEEEGGGGEGASAAAAAAQKGQQQGSSSSRAGNTSSRRSGAGGDGSSSSRSGAASTTNSSSTKSSRQSSRLWCPKLLSLDVSYNRVTTLSGSCLGGLRCLTQLDLQHNALDSCGELDALGRSGGG
jgi:hypothetical protein